MRSTKEMKNKQKKNKKHMQQQFLENWYDHGSNIFNA